MSRHRRQTIPDKRRARLDEIVRMMDQFCEEHLDAEFRDLCRDMAVVACLQGVPLETGKAGGWAAGIAYSVAWVNFLGDPTQPHHMTAEDMATRIGVSPATLMNRARVIGEALGPERMDPRWSTRRMVEQNPFNWMVLVDGLPYDIRMAPREVQEEAYRRGIIPFLPQEAMAGDRGA